MELEEKEKLIAQIRKQRLKRQKMPE